MKIIEYAKEHPISTGVILVVGTLVFYVIFTGGSSAQPQVVDSGPSDAEITANSAIKIAEIQAGSVAAQASSAVQAAQIGAGVQINSDTLAAQVALEQYRAGVLSANADRDAAITMAAAESNAMREIANMNLNATLADIAATKAIQTLQITEGTKIVGIQTDAMLEGARIAAAENESERLANLAMTNSILNQQTAMFTGLLNQQTNMAAIDAALETNISANNRDIQIAELGLQKHYIDTTANTVGLQITAGKEISLAEINANQGVAIATINAGLEQTQDYLAELQGLKPRNRDEALQAIVTKQVVQPLPGSSFSQDVASIAGGVTSVIGSIAPFLSDERAKENIVHVGSNEYGNVYEYNYKGKSKRYRSNMAGEIERNHRGDWDNPVRTNSDGMRTLPRWFKRKSIHRNPNKGDPVKANPLYLTSNQGNTPNAFNPETRSI